MASKGPSGMQMSIDDLALQQVAGRMEGISNAIETDQYIGSVVSWVHAELAPRFDIYLDARARGNPKAFHHVYEWPSTYGSNDTIGRMDARLWSHYIVGNGRDKVAGFRFRASKRPVPVHPLAATPGPNGKHVKIGFHVFVWKAAVMEFGTPVQISPQLSNWLALVPAGSNYLAFTQKTINMRGGTRDTRGSFTKEFALWWATQAPAYFDTYLRERLQRDVVQNGPLSNIVSKSSTSKSFSINTGSREAAYRRAEKKARADMDKNERSYISAALERMNNIGRL